VSFGQTGGVRFLPLVAIPVWLGALCTCAPDEGNFSQYPGFGEYFAAHPPSKKLPSPEDRTLLLRHRPRFILPQGHAGLIGFYEDYIAQGSLTDGNGRVISSEVGRELLNAHKTESHVVFVHVPNPGKAQHPVVYGRIDREEVSFSTDRGTVVEPLTLLSYHAVFRHSGLPAGLPAWQAAALAAAIGLSDWHQLDHYTAVTLALDRDRTPIALSLQQHNFGCTYLLGEDVELPPDGRPVVDVAIRSNELYPHRPGRTVHRAVAFPSPEAFRFLLGFGPRPRWSADDVTHGVEEAGYELRLLPPDDAFYTFQGLLGERRRLPGRSGPPGAAYNTIPQLKPIARQLFVSYWREGNRGDLQRFETTVSGIEDVVQFAEAQAAVFYRNWQCARQRRVGCAFE
jgi:hypothetical protein